MEEFYDSYAEEFLGGPKQYRVEVHDLQAGGWDIDRFDLGKYGDKWFVLRANGCSCWGGEWRVEFGPVDDLEDVRKFIHEEYGIQINDYYSEFVKDWNTAIDKAATVA